MVGGPHIIGTISSAFKNVNKKGHDIKKARYENNELIKLVAGVTRLELAAFPSCLTGRSNQPFDVFFTFPGFNLLFSVYCTGSVRVFFVIN